MPQQLGWTVPVIERVADDASRPLWSVMVPTYNTPAAYLREALNSVLSQDPGPQLMQIEVIDNCSDHDDPEPLVREAGNGRIAFWRQPANVGAIENFNTCIRRARGRWVHILHADDAVLPDFYARAAAAIGRHPDAGAIAMRIVIVNEQGNWVGLSELDRQTPGILGADFVEVLYAEQRIQFAGMIVRRSTYEEVGGFRRELPYCTDWDMWKRIAVRYPIYYDPQPLCCFRVHGDSLSSALTRTGQNVADERRSVETALSYLRPEDRPRMRRISSRAIAVRAIRNARSLWRARRYAAAICQLREGVRTSRAPAVLARLAHLTVWILFDSVAAPRRAATNARAKSDAPDLSVDAAD